MVCGQCPPYGTNKPTGAFVYLTPNQAEPDWSSIPAEGVTNPLNLLGISRPNITNALAWRSPSTWRIALPELQNILNSQSDLPKFNFNAGYDNLLTLGQYTPSNLGNSAPLLADISEGNIFIGFISGPTGTNSRAEDPIRVDSIQVNIIRAWNPADIYPGSDGWAIASNQPSQITSLEDQYSSVKIMPNHLAGSEIAIDKFSRKKTSLHNGILQATSPHRGHIAELPFTVREIAVNEFATNSDISSRVRFAKNLLENSSGEIGTFQINPSSTSTTPNNARQDDTLKVSLPSSVSSQQLFSSNLSHDNSSLLTDIYNTAQTLWHTTTPIDLNFAITNLPTGQLAEGTITSYNTNGTPKTATITIDDDANGVGWFIDSTPQDNSEFTGTDTYFQATPNSPASGKYDLLTAILHEMGHTLGFINGYSQFNQHIKNGIFTTDTFTTKLTPDGSHLDSTLYPYDLMNTSLKPGVRKLPSTMDWAIIDALNSGVGSQVSGVDTVNPAHLTAGALIGITNGDFTTPTTWNTLGATNIINGSATLTEQSQKLSELTQAFIIPTGAKTLQFTITDNHLIPGDTTKAANDAFEVALLDTNTYNPLAGTSIGLNHTDSLLNIQANGTIFHSDKVTITALGNNSSIVTIALTRRLRQRLTQVTPTTQATLYFNLLSFASQRFANDAKTLFNVSFS